MTILLDDFLLREERRRNRSLSKRFCAWLTSQNAEHHVAKLERLLAKPGNESQAVRLLAQLEEVYKADDVHKKQDNKRKKSLKQFQAAFENWLQGDKAKDYRTQIENARNDEERASAQDDAERAFVRANPHLLPDDYKDAAKTRIRPVRFAFPQDVEDLTLSVIEPGLSQLGLVGAEILRSWDKIVGASLAQNTRPERVSFPPKMRANGTLFIKARPGFNTIVQHNSAEIVFRLNGHFGFKAINDIRISKRPFDENLTTGTRVANRVISTRVQPANKLSPHMAKLVETIKDPEMRKAFEELGKVIQARNS